MALHILWMSFQDEGLFLPIPGLYNQAHNQPATAMDEAQAAFHGTIL